MDQIQNNIGYKYDFEISILSMKIEYKLPFNFRLLFKRGNKQNEIEKTFKYDPSSNTNVNINENFTLTCIMKPETESQEKIDLSNPQFSEKKYKLYVCIYTKTGFKPAISGEFNLSDFVNSNSKNNISEMVLSNKTFTNIKIKYKINSSFIGECDINQFSNENNETNEISKLEPDNSNFTGSSNNNMTFNNNPASTNNNKITEPEKSEKLDNILNDLSKKNEDQNPHANTNKIKLTLTATNTPIKNALNSNNVKDSNGIFDDSKAKSNSKEKEFEIEKVKNEYEEKANEFRLTIDKLQSQLNDEEKQKQDLMDSQRIKDLEFINLVEDNEKFKEDLTKYQESEIDMSNEISNLKKDLESLKIQLENSQSENKELKIQNNSLQGKIENLNHSINILNETLKDLREKANTNSNSISNNNNTHNNYSIVAQLEEKDRIINEIKAENEYQVDEINLLKSVTEDLKKEKKQIFEEKNEQINKLKSQLEECNNNLYDVKKTNEQSANKLNDLKRELEKLNKENEELKNKKKELETTLKTEVENNKQKIRDNSKESQNERDQIYKKFNEEIDTIKANFNKSLDEKDSEIEKFRSQLSNNSESIQIEKQGLENIIKNLNNEIQILEEKLNFKETELQILKEDEDKNIGGMKSEISEYLISLKEKDSQIKENKAEINNLTNTINMLEEKLKLISIEKDGQIQSLFDSEKNLKDNVILYKQKLEEKDNYLQNILDEKEKLKFESEKLRADIINAEKNKTNDEDLINQINQIQIKAAEKEKKIVEEKDQEIKQLKKDIETLRQENKRSNTNNSERENAKSLNEILYLKKEIEELKQENKEAKQGKENVIKLERTILDLQNNLAIKKVEISQCETEKEKLASDNRKTIMEINEQKLKIENLEQDLVYTKQKLGDVLNELSEMENYSSNKSPEKLNESGLEKKKTGFSSFFSKKK